MLIRIYWPLFIGQNNVLVGQFQDIFSGALEIKHWPEILILILIQSILIFCARFAEDILAMFFCFFSSRKQLMLGL